MFFIGTQWICALTANAMRKTFI